MSRTPSGGAPSGRLVIVFGDQLDPDAAPLRELDPGRDVVLLMEVREESTRVQSHRQRTALFLSAMRHFAADLETRGLAVRYVRLDDPHNTHTFAGEIRRATTEHPPTELWWTLPGDWRVRSTLHELASSEGIAFREWEDEHFLTSVEDFTRWAQPRKRLRLEDFYRWQRRRLGVLVDGAGRPTLGRWNFDEENRKPFDASGPARDLPRPLAFPPDEVTREVLDRVRSEFGDDLPGRLEPFDWPVTRAQARQALHSFIEDRLPSFGRHQDAMWTGEPFLHHSLLSPALNLKLLHPRECIDAAVKAWERGHAPIESVEGFVRQILGWREFVRGVYWLEGPDYRRRNALAAEAPLPEFYWTGETDYRCLSETLHEVLDHAYGHHIQRLMVTGNFALLAGIRPAAVADWYLGMYADGVDWVTTPNVVGMTLHADARPGETEGVVGSKPYASSGRYVSRMSNYCESCPYDPAQRIGAEACPFTTLYWDFLLRHERRFRRHPRMALAVKNLGRIEPSERRAIRRRADEIRRRIGSPTTTATRKAARSKPRSDRGTYGEAARSRSTRDARPRAVDPADP